MGAPASSDAFARAIEILSDSLRSHPAVLMVADAYDHSGPHIIVVVRDGATIPSDIPARFNGFRVVVQRSAEIVPH